MENKVYFLPDPKPAKVEKPYKGLKRVAIKKNVNDDTKEYDFMLEVFTERGGICEVSGEKLEFSPSCCHHLLNKNNYKRFRTYKKNLVVIKKEVHYLYHNASKQIVLQQYPKATILYDRLEELRIEYNNLPTI